MLLAGGRASQIPMKGESGILKSHLLDPSQSPRFSCFRRVVAFDSFCNVCHSLV